MRVPVPQVIAPAEQLGRVHFVGIGGAGLSAIARVMLARGVPVSGSDGADSTVLAGLREQGASVWVGHDADHVAGADTLVVSVAVSDDNPEVAEARRRGLTVLPRSAGLAAVLAGRRALCVSGTHGKTTVSAMLTVALRAAGADPSYAIGADIAATGANAGVGSGELFVAEADESDGAFLVYQPYVAVVTNIEADHLDQWGTPEAYAAGFETFADHVDPEGFLVCCVDDPGAAALAVRQQGAGRRVMTVGLGEAAGLRGIGLGVVDGVQRLTVTRDGVALGDLHLRTPGAHFAVDALAAFAVGLGLGLPFEALADGLAGFTGSRRRMERRGEAGGVLVYDSYAHHPTEIAADLAAARLIAGEGRVVVGYQPHLVSRTRALGADMGRALGAADEIVVTDVYAAREPSDPAVTGALVADAVPLPTERVHYEPDLGSVAPTLTSIARRGDLVLTLGAGSITECAGAVLDLLTGEADHG